VTSERAPRRLFDVENLDRGLAHGDAPLFTQLAIVLGAALAGLVVWSLPDLASWASGAKPAVTVATKASKECR